MLLTQSEFAVSDAYYAAVAHRLDRNGPRVARACVDFCRFEGSYIGEPMSYTQDITAGPGLTPELVAAMPAHTDWTLCRLTISLEN